MSLIFIQHFHLLSLWWKKKKKEKKAYAPFSKSPSRSNYQKFYVKLKVITWAILFSVSLSEGACWKVFFVVNQQRKVQYMGKRINEPW